MTEFEILKENLEITRVVMIITVIMAIITATFSALDVAFQRSHNKRTIRPYCSIHRSITNNSIAIYLKNAGLGPLIIADVILTNDKDESMINGNIIPYYKGVESSIRETIRYSETRIVPSLAEVCIMDVKNESAGNNSLIEQYLDISLCIEYRDLYDHKYKIIEPIIRKDLNQEKV
jgi:hypothetical protein